jgi:hypothetical protein
VTTDDLRAARDRVRRLEQLRRHRAGVAAQLADVDRHVARLRAECAAEEEDVRRLERRTLTSIVAGVLGTRDDRLARERAEADLARVRLTGHEARHRRLTADLDFLELELADLADAPSRYEQAMADAEAELRRRGDPRAAELTRITVGLADIDAELRERAEARAAGEAAQAAVAGVLGPLGAAANWSTVDLFGGGVLADLGEHNQLSSAHDAAWRAQQALDRFAREMADLGVEVHPRMPEVDTRWFVDTLFDNIITDALRHQRIARTREQTVAVARWLESSVRRLGQERQALLAERNALRAERARLHDG